MRLAIYVSLGIAVFCELQHRTPRGRSYSVNVFLFSQDDHIVGRCDGFQVFNGIDADDQCAIVNVSGEETAYWKPSSHIPVLSRFSNTIRARELTVSVFVLPRFRDTVSPSDGLKGDAIGVAVRCMPELAEFPPLGQTTLRILYGPLVLSVTAFLAVVCAASLAALHCHDLLVVRRIERRRRLGVCIGCGYDNLRRPGRCPECGHTA